MKMHDKNPGKHMKKMIITTALMCLILNLFGCGGSGGDGGGGYPPPVSTYEVNILSDPYYDGDIKFVPPNFYTVTQDVSYSIFAGLDPHVDMEYRAFLDFPLTGKVPGNAFIDSATLDIFIASVNSEGKPVPIRIELVSFTPPNLVASDYDRIIQRPLASKSTTIYPSDAGHHVLLDVTPLMAEAQRRGLSDFQIRILEDLGTVFPGIIEIDETTDTKAPLLNVVYY